MVGSIGKRNNNILGVPEVRCEEVILSWYWKVKSATFGRTNLIHINPSKLLLIYIVIKTLSFVCLPLVTFSPCA